MNNKTTNTMMRVYYYSECCIQAGKVVECIEETVDFFKLIDSLSCEEKRMELGFADGDCDFLEGETEKEIVDYCKYIVKSYDGKRPSFLAKVAKNVLSCIN